MVRSAAHYSNVVRVSQVDVGGNFGLEAVELIKEPFFQLQVRSHPDFHSERGDRHAFRETSHGGTNALEAIERVERPCIRDADLVGAEGCEFQATTAQEEIVGYPDPVGTECLDQLVMLVG